MIEKRLIGTETLVAAAFRPDIVESYCEHCVNYESNFSCPSHSFSTAHYLTRYPYVLVYVHTIPLAPGADPQLFFDELRELIDPALMEFERRFHGEALLPGCCRNCSDDCSRLGAQECRTPELLRYSLESLGIDIDQMLRFFFESPLRFSDEQMTFVYGFFLSSPPDPIRLVELESELINFES